MIKPIQDFDGFTPEQVVKLLIMRTLWRWEQQGESLSKPWEPEVVDKMFKAYMDEDMLTDAINDTRHQGEQAKGIGEWTHHTWSRYYDVSVHAFPLSSTKALAWNFVSGGGKHGEPESYKWYQEPRFVEITGTETIIRRSYAAINEAVTE